MTGHPPTATVAAAARLDASPSPSSAANEDLRHDKMDASATSTFIWPSTRFSLPHEVAFVSLLSMAQLLTQAGLALSIVPLHDIGAHFSTTNSGTLSWYPAAYSLTVGTFILPAGRIGDLVGHRRLFIAGWVWYGVWSIIGGLSWYSNQVLFIFCRALQGIGPAILLPNSLAIIGRTYAPNTRRKEMIFSLYGATAPCGFVIGGAFAGVFTQFARWAWAYWVMGLVCLACAALTPLVVPRDETSAGGWTWSQLDVTGTIVGVTALVLFNFAWNQGPVVGWSAPYVPVCLGLGVALFVAFAFVEGRAAHPLIPLKQLNREIALVMATVACGWGSFGIWLYYLFQFLTVLRGHTPLGALAQVSTPAVSGTIAAFTTGFLISRISPPLILLASLVAFCVGNILLASMPVQQTFWAQTFVSGLITPWGMDMSFPSSNIIMSDFMPRHAQGLAASLVNTAINYSISIALGMAGTIEVHIDGTLQGYRAAWYFAIGISGLGVAIAAFTVWDTGRRVHEPARKDDEKGED